MAINLEKKSNRLLGNRRFTSDALNTSQEAFTDVLDIGTSEVFTQASSIPSSGLPFSGSSQNGDTHQVGGYSIMRYYYRQRLTRSNVANDVFFFMNPTGSVGGVTPQLIQNGQQGNFISPKYSVSSLANSNTEDGTPGYGVKVFKSTSLNSGSLGNSDIVSTNDYQFDYKTGVLQFDSALSSNLEVYVSAYQYIGTTLETRLEINSGTGSFGALNVNSLFTYGSTTWRESSGDNVLTGSKFTFKSSDATDLLRVHNSSDELVLRVGDGFLVLNGQSSPPTAQAGGIYYGTDDEWYLGFDS